MLTLKTSTAYRVTVSDGSLSFSATAASETQAILEALDKIGFTVQPSKVNANTYLVLDADTHCVEHTINTTITTDGDVLQRALELVGWSVVDSQEIAGGSIGGGYHLADNES